MAKALYLRDQVQAAESHSPRPQAPANGSVNPAAPGDRQGQFREYTLSSAYQPIVSPTLRRTVGYEALLRAQGADGRPVPPLDVFAAAHSIESTIELDRRCRTLHVQNFVERDPGNVWLFLNISPKVAVDGPRYGSFFAHMLATAGLPAQRVVVEILESAIRDEGLLGETVGYYKELGCLVAIDDFGAGLSNFDRIVRLEPDMVKIDRSLIRQARDQRIARRLLPSLVATLHELGCLVVLEGPEDAEDAALALDCGADFVQGFYFGRPGTETSLPSPPVERFHEAAEQAHNHHAAQRNRREGQLAPYRSALQQAALAYAQGDSLPAACAALLTMGRTLHCYALDEHGVQVSEDLFDKGIANNPRYAPLLDTTHADWRRKPYFRQAVAEPDRIHLTRPYFSATEARLCITLSTAVERNGALQVLCFKLAWDDLA